MNRKLRKTREDGTTAILFFLLQLTFRHWRVPEAVQIAVGINSFYFALLAFELGFRRLAGFENLEVETVFSLQCNHHDVMLFCTWMFNSSNFDLDGTIVQPLHYRKMFLLAIVYTLRFEKNHL